MKKFLSVLLALAVAFTFTFGSTMSAFAEGPVYTDSDVYLQAVADAEKAAVKQLDAQYNVAVATIEAAEKYTVAATSGTVDVYAAAWLKAMETLKTDMNAAITARTNELTSDSNWNRRDTAVSATDYTNSSVTAINGKFDSAENIISTLRGTEAYKLIAAKEQAAADKAKYVAAATNTTIDTTVYSTTDEGAGAYKLTVTAKYNNAKAYADALIEDLAAKLLKDDVNVVATDNTSAKVADKMQKMTALFTDVVDYNETTKVYTLKETGTYSVYGAVGTDFYKANGNTTGSDARINILSIKEENAANQNVTYNVQANVNAAYNTVYGTSINGETQNADAIAKFQELADAYTAVQTYLGAPIEKFPALNGTYSEGNPEYTIEYDNTKKVYVLTEGHTSYIANAKAVKDSEAVIAALKATGNYDNDALDRVMKNYKDATYAAATTSATPAVALSSSSAEVKACLKNTVTDFNKAVEKENFAKTFVDAEEFTINFVPTYDATTLTSGTTVYYEKEWAEVETAIAAYYNAIDNATLTTDLTAAVKALNNALYAVKTASKIDTAVAADSAMQTALTYNAAEILAYINSLNANKAAGDQVATQLIGATNEATISNIKDAIIANGARTAADVPTVAAALKGEIAATATPNQLKTQREAVEALIKALPGTIKMTIADKAQVKAAYDALVAYNNAKAETSVTTRVANEGTLQAAIKKINSLEYAEVTEAYKKIVNNSTSTVTIADKETVLAAKAVCDAFLEGYAVKGQEGAAEDGMYTYVGEDIALETVDTNGYATKLGDAYARDRQGNPTSLYAAIKDLEEESIEKAIKGLTNESTPAEIEAVKAAYDAYVAEYTSVEDYCDAAAEISDAAKLNALAASIIKYTDVNAKADLLDMSRKLTIWRTSKTSIKVTTVGSVKNIKANGYTVKYSFYKKNPGATSYKLIKTTTSNKYTYTNLKKGTNKFQVKVKVYDADGKLVATKMTYYRAAKVK